MPPQSSVTTSVAAITVTNARSVLPKVARAVVVATTARTAATASCRPPMTPRGPILHALIPSVTAAAPRYRAIPSGSLSISRPPKTNAASEIAINASTAPMSTPAMT